MTVSTAHIELNTKGKTDIVDLTSQVSDNLNKTKMSCGTVTVFVIEIGRAHV